MVMIVGRPEHCWIGVHRIGVSLGTTRYQKFDNIEMPVPSSTVHRRPLLFVLALWIMRMKEVGIGPIRILYCLKIARPNQADKFAELHAPMLISEDHSHQGEMRPRSLLSPSLTFPLKRCTHAWAQYSFSGRINYYW